MERGFLLKAWILFGSLPVLRKSSYSRGQLLFFPTNFKADSTFPHNLLHKVFGKRRLYLRSHSGNWRRQLYAQVVSDVSPWSPLLASSIGPLVGFAISVSLPKFSLWDLPSSLRMSLFPFPFGTEPFAVLASLILDTHTPHLRSTCSSPIEMPAAIRTHAMESGLWVTSLFMGHLH